MAELDETGKPLRNLKAFSLAERSARHVLRRRMRVLFLTRNAYAKLAGEGNVLGQAGDDLRVMLRLARAWARREYRTVPWKSMLYAVAAIVYFLNPADLIPDTLAGIGFIDDVAVITTVVTAIRDDLDAFRAWERLAIGEGSSVESA